MTDLYMDQPGSKKKYLVPLVILLLCAVSLTGAGFAYNSQVTVESEKIPVHSFELIIGDDNTISASTDIYFDSAVYNIANDKKTVYSVDNNNTEAVVFEVKINDNSNAPSAANKKVTAKVSEFTIELYDATGTKVADMATATGLHMDVDTELAVGTVLSQDTPVEVSVAIVGSIEFDDFESAPSSTYYLFVSIKTAEVDPETDAPIAQA